MFVLTTEMSFPINFVNKNILRKNLFTFAGNTKYFDEAIA